MSAGRRRARRRCRVVGQSASVSTVVDLIDIEKAALGHGVHVQTQCGLGDGGSRGNGREVELNKRGRSGLDGQGDAELNWSCQNCC